MRKITASAVLDRLIPALGLKTDSELARLLDTAPSTISSWRKRNSVPFAICAKFAEEHDWSLDWLMFGEGGTQQPSTTSSQVTAKNPRESAVLTLFRTLTEDEQREIQTAAEEKKRLRELEQRLETMAALLAEKRCA